MFFVFTDPVSDRYPPHLNLGANQPYNKDKESGPATAAQGSALSQGDIFSALRLAQLTALVPQVIPHTFIGEAGAKVGQAAAWTAYGGMGRPDAGKKIADVESYNNQESSKRWYQKDIFDLPNIGNLTDWYSDARFAQQYFTGTNPTTIKQAGDWAKVFIDNATDPGDSQMKAKISKRAAESPGSLYVQDYSYFRKAAGTEDFRCEFEETYKEGFKTEKRTLYRYALASVCLFNLTDSGTLEPLAIIIDWRGSADKSVFIYNKELNVDEQKGDWAWRYAKTCVQASDWLQHNITVHLCRTHLVEEAVIVAANRTLPQEHDVFQLLYPHWLKTLSLNAAARSVLMPFVIAPIVGMPDDNVYQFLRYEYDNFDFQGSYIPEDLKRRGFPTEKLNDKKYHNYAWARCIHSMWFKIRSYVQEMLTLKYSSDQEVRDDPHVQAWSREMRAPVQEQGANISTFPELQTLDALVDCVTMCIHIASPQHTSVNYLQNYYQAFVVNKPPSLYRAPPASRAELGRYAEDDLVRALPMNHPHEWLLASHIPYLLSFKPGDKESLIMYAASKYHVYKFKKGDKEQKIKEAAARFYEALARSESEFKTYGEDTDDHNTITYDVLSPSWNAVSILI
ncbi:uncharacterized protein PG998_012043 [Apiospora kogelbergensis]|uniref:uncharacterized protein n=1 Tax=Apiospora kogelbergensis TaxID=1337665 RepID=UPI00312E5D93